MENRLKTIQKQIEELGEDKIKEIQTKFTSSNGMVPYSYQCVMYNEIAKRISRYEHPFIAMASVSAGKTLVFGMVAKRCSELGLPMLVLARQAELVSQNASEISDYGVPNSIYCSGLGIKSSYFPVVVGSEGTVVGGLKKSLGDFCPAVVAIDECHHIDDQDIAEAIDNNETAQQASDKGRSQYTVIILTLMERCRAKYGKNLRIFGLTGSPFRGTTPIVVENKKELGFWRETVTNIDTNYLVEFGSVVPTNFGATDGVGYDLSEFDASSEDGVQDYTKAQLEAMDKKIQASGTMTAEIMKKVWLAAKNRNGVLVTCAGERHCHEAASYLPEGEKFCIITGKTGEKQRKELLDKCFSGEIKYCFQVQALTTGVNVPTWDTSVILRKIGSLTLLVQLLGRGMRKLKKLHEDKGMVKNDHLVLDFAGTMDSMASLYFNPILEQAQYQLRKSNGKETKQCPVCGTENSFFARRCMHIDENNNRCEYFWVSRTCEDQKDPRTGKVIVKGCGVQNDVAAKICRGCDCTLLDPNLNLSGKHYRKNDWFDVVDFKVGLTKNQSGIIYNYILDDGMGGTFKAHEVFFVESDHRVCKTLWLNNGIKGHVVDMNAKRYMAAYRNARKIMEYAQYIHAPKRVTHRKTAKGGDNIANKEF
ncbi:putative ATP-dependent helicase [Enterobacteria phage vB_EcoS_Rogue1]|uniref:ATP-dependent helicase n=4 Tax=Rogunavirus TaxID=1920866 RepID=A0A067YW79_9CAUD|nr:putative ATP-dependent helicase [Enterobacteria phage vB_EcoS_Rogue1]YP_009055379.1 ATP-dependent helicase [Escherichia phage vB_EcoS_AHS24]YP_009056553.1 ATP-dependent helicase [Escherichia phage vB_EcoS_AHP42]AHI60505.1 ATP-dependent helicase [Escherichia phage bV_EcoS_AHP24]AFM76601.1 putative ATP-dependent helicase [Enterobacteria phage vB_EcoS_Rogue1]AHI60583.1 ATP-dependent helicase [Escherichia phage vB_EcoS_AHP42]AHI60661.1 ATP-dependent helicase [Escherichia phage vB_EcoS_AHS24]